MHPNTSQARQAPVECALPSAADTAPATARSLLHVGPPQGLSATHLPRVRHTPASGASPPTQVGPIHLTTRPPKKKGGYRYPSTLSENTRPTFRYYLPLIFQKDHISSYWLFNVFPGINFRLPFCKAALLSHCTSFCFVSSWVFMVSSEQKQSCRVCHSGPWHAPSHLVQASGQRFNLPSKPALCQVPERQGRAPGQVGESLHCTSGLSPPVPGGWAAHARATLGLRHSNGVSQATCEVLSGRAGFQQGWGQEKVGGCCGQPAARWAPGTDSAPLPGLGV